jgi:hypothetical protein
MLARAGCNNVEALNVDFLTTDVRDEKYAHVTHMYVRSVRTCQVVFHPFNEKLVSLIRPAVVLESLTASTTSWNLVRVCQHYGLRAEGSLTSLIPPRHREEGESSSVTHAERLTKLAAFQLQMLRHAMRCMSPPFFSFFVLPSSGVISDELSELTPAA